MPTLAVRNFAQISSGQVEFGDFTLLVGPQASGKSLFLQLLKLLVDKDHISDTLKTFGYDWGKNSKHLLELFFGEGMSGIWKDNTRVEFDKIEATSSDFFLPKPGRPSAKVKEENLFYIPAQRVTTMFQGWPRSFGAFEIGDPYVMKAFGETLRILMEKESGNGQTTQSDVFPRRGKMNKPLRDEIDRTIFYGASVKLDKRTLKRRFMLHVGDSELPLMSWSAGQKEFLPLLLSLYHLIPPSKVSRKGEIEWVVMEEPEMGLHPKAIQAVLLLCFELMERGYKVVISTHSPVLLELAWTMNYIQSMNGTAEDLAQLFATKRTSLKKLYKTIIDEKAFKTYYFQRGEGDVTIKDISSLDAGSDDAAEADWGGLSEFASRAAEVIAKLAAHG
ncbi:MAG: ATP-binding protein [Bacteroidetes bacterium]|nr:MAG: ATP-binding protein [Bacteroidota bacterium]